MKGLSLGGMGLFILSKEQVVGHHECQGGSYLVILQKLSYYFAKTSEILSGIIIAALTIVLLAQVILRTFFNSGISWSVEFSIYASIWAVMLIGNVLIRDNEMITVDFFDMYFSEKFIKYRDILYQVVFIGLMVLMIYFGFKQAVHGLNMNTATLQIKWFYPYLAIPVGMSLMLFQYVVKIVENIVGKDVK